MEDTNNNTNNMTTILDNTDPAFAVEEGKVVPGVMTSTSVDSGSTTGSTTDGADAENASSRRSRQFRLAAGAAVVFFLMAVVTITTGAVLGARGSNTSSNKEIQSQASTSTTTATTTTETTSTTPSDRESEPILDTNTETEADTNTDTPPSPQDLGTLPKPFADVDDFALPLFDEDTFLNAYTSREELQADLTKVTKSLVNAVVMRNLAAHSSSNNNNNEVPLEDVAAMAAQASVTASAASAEKPQSKTVTSSLTNNQEQDADEADLVKNDDTYVYAAYGDYLVVWDRQGNMIAQERMPAPTTEAPTASPSATTTGEGTESVYMDDFLFSQSSMYIESLLLTDEHVVAFVSGHGIWRDDHVSQSNGNATHVRFYNKPTAASPSLELAATHNIHGIYQSSRFMESSESLQIVTGGDLNLYSMLIDPLDVYNFPWTTQAEYVQEATKLAQDVLVPRFVAQLTDFIESCSGRADALPAMIKINRWMTETMYKAVDEQQPQDPFYEQEEALRAFGMVTSIRVPDIAPAVDAGEPIPSSASLFLGPSAYVTPYMSKNSIVLAVSRYQWIEATQTSIDTLFFLHLKIQQSGAFTSFESYTAVEGTLPQDRHAMDVHGNDLRLATTLQKWDAQDNVWTMCGDSVFYDDCMTQPNWDECFDVAMSCRNVVKTGCPYVFSCADEEGTEEDKSSTDNYIMVFDLSQPGAMKEIGRVRIGEPHEVITSVHFGDDFSYATTFDQRDPFYVLKMEPGRPPVVAGSLKLEEGFASHLLPLQSDDGKTLVLGIGQNVNGTGLEQINTGVVVSIFDVSDPSKPSMVASRMVVDGEAMNSGSLAEWESRAIQYKNGILSIPLHYYPSYELTDDLFLFDELATEGTVAPEEVVTSKSGGDSGGEFDGFIVLNVGNAVEDGIQELFRINHLPTEGERCHYCGGSLSEKRSFLFDDGDLMTMSDSIVVSMDVNSGAELWSLKLDIEGADMSCCW